MIEPTHASATHGSDKEKIHNPYNTQVATKRGGILNRDLPSSDKKRPTE